MINRCGYITTVNRDTNKNDCITVISFEGNNVYNCDRRLFSKYVFRIKDKKLIERKTNEFSDIPYIKLLELIDKCLSVDKNNTFYKKYAFGFDVDGTVKIFEKEIIKDVFPIPSKNLSYLTNNCYYNITGYFFGSFVVSTLLAYVATDLLNNIVVSNGFVWDRMFEHSCGRIFINISLFAYNVEGRSFLKRFVNEYSSVIRFSGMILKSLKIKKTPVIQNATFSNNLSSNDFIKVHSDAANKLVNKNIFDVILNFGEFINIVNNELFEIETYFAKVYHIFNGVMPKDLKHFSIEDLLKLYIDADFSYDIVNYISDKRKIYNANKHKNILCIKSDGSLYCI